MEQVGHVKIVTTMRYNRVCKDDIREYLNLKEVISKTEEVIIEGNKDIKEKPYSG